MDTPVGANCSDFVSDAYWLYFETATLRDKVRSFSLEVACMWSLLVEDGAAMTTP